MTINEQLANEFQMNAKHVENTVALLDDGATVPFIARYRKDETGALDDQAVRAFADRLSALRKLEERRADVTRLIAEQGKLTDALAEKIAAAESLTALDDLYRPYRPKRKTRASIAAARGLTPLAEAWTAGASAAALAEQAESLAQASDELADEEAAVAGACDILAEALADDAEMRARLREELAAKGVIHTKAGKTPDPTYDNYLDYSEPLAKMAAHRVLAVGRAEREDALAVSLEFDEERAVYLLYKHIYRKGMAWQERLQEMCRDSWKRLLKPSLEKEVRKARTEWAEDQSTVLFKRNLRDLLLQPPVRGHVVLGFDPGFANGCKLAVIDATGNVLETTVVYPFKGKGGEAKAKEILRQLIDRHRVTLVAIGNGTASRESERLIAGILDGRADCGWYIVSEAGASVYSASPLAAEEFPDLDATLRSAVSIARRVQDPLAELVKIDPRSIGVGQYQHDIDQKKLTHALDGVVEDCVNHVGVDLNTASVSLLSHVAGVTPRKTSSPIATKLAIIARAKPCSRCQSWGRKPLNNAPDSCASPTATSRWTTPRCIRKATPACAPWPSFSIVRRRRPLSKKRAQPCLQPSSLSGSTSDLRRLQIFSMPSPNRDAIRATICHSHCSRTISSSSRIWSLAWSLKAPSQTSLLLARLSTSVYTKTAWCTSPSFPIVLSRIRSPSFASVRSCASRFWMWTNSAAASACP